MARFKYMGELENNFVLQHGPCLQIKIPLKNGSKMILTAPNQSIGFPKNEDIGVNITDERSLRYLRADGRFQEI